MSEINYRLHDDAHTAILIHLSLLLHYLGEVKVMEEKIKDRRSPISEVKLTIILIALGVFRDRAETMPEREKKKRIQKWITSILDYTATEMQVAYKFPYADLLNAREIESQLRDRVGVEAIETSSLQEPHRKPTNMTQRIESLQFYDGIPDESAPQQSRESSDLTDAVIAGIIKKSFLKPLEGNDKAATRLGHQNEPNYIKQFYQDSCAGLVLGVQAIDVLAAGLAMKEGKPFVRCSADAIVIEQKEFDEIDLNRMDEDDLKSHPVECKCRSELGYDGSLNKANIIAKQIAEAQGIQAKYRQSLGHAMYCSITSSDRQMAKLIPDKSERIQILHHAYTYGTNRTTFLVGNPQGKIIYGVVVNFEESLLRSYGEVLDHLYQNGLKTFYEDQIDDLPLDYIESVLLGDEKLKKKYTIDDFIFSLLIWRDINPISSNSSPPKYPIPPCDMLVPLDCSLWNSSKGGSDTVTRFAWNCKIIVPIRTPQTIVVARFLALYSVLFHRLIQVVTMSKKPDVETDTIKHIRDRNNKHWPFHKSLSELSDRLLGMSQRALNGTAAQNSNNGVTEYTRESAVRFSRSNQNVRYEIDHSIMGPVDVTGATPISRGASKNPRRPGPEFESYKRRCIECVVGTPMRLSRQKSNGTFKFDGKTCDLCGSRGVPWMCRDCKRVLCFDEDRTAVLREKLKTTAADRLCEMAPEFVGMERGNAPAFHTQVGELKGKMAYTRRSCFHYCHPMFFNGNDKQDSQAETRDDPLSSYSSANADSPLAG